MSQASTVTSKPYPQNWSDTLYPNHSYWGEEKELKPLVFNSFSSVWITGTRTSELTPPVASQLALSPSDNHHFSNYRKGESDGFHHVG